MAGAGFRYRPGGQFSRVDTVRLLVAFVVGVGCLVAGVVLLEPRAMALGAIFCVPPVLAVVIARWCRKIRL